MRRPRTATVGRSRCSVLSTLASSSVCTSWGALGPGLLKLSLLPLLTAADLRQTTYIFARAMQIAMHAATTLSVAADVGLAHGAFDFNSALYVGATAMLLCGWLGIGVWRARLGAAVCEMPSCAT